METETEAQKSWGDLPCEGCPTLTIRETVAALKYDMAHNRFEWVMFRMARLTDSDKNRIRFFAPELES